MLQGWRQDLGYGVRALRRGPLFAATAVLSLAIGIGANTAIFSVASGLLLRPRPGIADPARVVDVGRTVDGRGFDNMSYLNYRDLRDRNGALSGLAAYLFEPRPYSIRAGGGEAERAFGKVVTANSPPAAGHTPCRSSFASVRISGRHPSRAAICSTVPVKPRSATPTTVTGWPLSDTVLPTTPGSAPKRRVQ